MKRRFLIAAAVIARAAAAQGTATSTLDLNAIGLRYADSVSSGGISISPVLSLVRGRSSFDAGGTLSRFGSGTSAQGALDLSTFSPAWRRLSAELAASAGGSTHHDGYSTGQGRGSARIHYASDARGAWAGGGAGAMWDGASWRSIRQLEGGAWVTRASAQLVVSATPTVVDDTIRYTDAQAAVTWKTSRVDFGLTAGVRGGSRLPALPGESSVWGGASIVAPMSGKASVVITAGSYPPDFTQGFPSGRYISAGLRFSAGRQPADARMGQVPRGINRFDVRRLNESEIAIEVRAPAAASVEIMGDITHWEPRALAGSNGRFSIVLPVTSGTSQINIRIDGGPWAVPPGLTVVKDELGTEVGILVVPDR